MDRPAVNPPIADPHPADPELVPPDLCRCAACGYRLGGLPRVGRCPECQAAYDRGEVVLVGRAAGVRTLLYWRGPAGAVSFVLALMVCVAVWMAVTGGRDLSVPVVCSAALLLIVPPVLARVRGMRSAGGPEVVVRKTSDGVGATTGPTDAAGVPLTPWANVTRLRLIPKRNGRLWVWVQSEHRDLFDALVECPAESVPELQRIVGRWFGG